jgi:hypothetical protein
MSITIYSNSAHILQHYTSSPIILPTCTNIDSIILTNSSNNIIPFSYISSKPDQVTVTKNNQSFYGKISNLDNNNITITTPDQSITIRNYDTLSSNITHSQLLFDQPNVTLSYLCSNINWSCIGTALIDGTNLMLRLAAHIVNDTENTLEGNIKLVSGAVRQKVHELAAPRAMVLSDTPKVSISKAEDYTVYDVGSQKINKHHIVELGTQNYPITKIYEHRTNSPGTKFGYRFIATGFIPDCNINVFKGETFVGTAHINESQKSDDVDVFFGLSSIIHCESSVAVKDKLEEIHVDIKNHSVDDIVLIVKHYVGNKAVTVQCQSYKKRKDGYIEWYFNIPGSESGVFECRISI